jgi:hypothetical protein
MTAEIAIINRAAVTLASDSATTLQVRGTRKIYTSADKIFEASANTPIGLMIYNNLEFLGLPLEVAIKHFREMGASKKPFAKVENAARGFLDYLETGLPPSRDAQVAHIRSLVYTSFGHVNGQFWESVFKWEKGNTKKDPNYNSLFAAAIQEEISYLESLAITESLKDLKPERVLQEYLAEINDEIQRRFGDLPINDEHKNLLRSLAVAVLLREEFSNESSTGLVFAGFGSEELFPSIYAFEVDGVICGRIKYRPSDKVEMSRDRLGAKVLPFAQREMADRFLDGIDPEFEDGMTAYLRRVLTATGNEIIKITPRQSKKTKDALRKKLDDAVKSAVKHWEDQGAPKIKEKFRQQIEDMALFMPKPELASLAEAMVNLTSVKRKYSRGEEESVGGPVDVAMISKSEGFVWVKRKHYFDPKLNPRYFHRKFGGTHARD